ncbi:ABC transporter ATP-binding protein [Alicyclobacillus acidiphilus]|uniref:ABC transporter ATP-binding protein n=1 Tax=Alicyclobacillus acidiphilus TaxID=182455 RepID=UPI00082D5055|nr:ABC transporter ATP-binding protein [Alicyclobacillus acidiphilus]
MLEVKNLKRTFTTKDNMFGRREVKAVRDVSFTIPDGGVISFIGESGCGKTTIGRIVAGLETPTDGTVLLDGIDIHRANPKERRELMRQIQLIQQDPYQALNPAHTIEEALAQPLRLMAKRKAGVSNAWIQDRMAEVLSLVGLDPAAILYKYPHMLSGGQRQRVVIARALTVEPKVLVADEAVSMIDVSLRLGVLHLLRNLREKLNISVLFITHDVAASRYLGRDGKVFVIYKGMIVEEGATDTVINGPTHPYTQALLSAVPVLKGLEVPGSQRFYVEKELSQDGLSEEGCLFASRCPFATAECRRQLPPLAGDSHKSACLYPYERQVTARMLD